MHLKEQRFHSIMDIYAFRVIVKEVDTCYRVLGQCTACTNRARASERLHRHSQGQRLSIAAYLLIGLHGVPVEVQIRTEDMDQMAEMGVAAHWAYKEREQGETGTTAQIRAQRWMQSPLELQQSAGSSFEFIESVKSDLFPDEIYVFTPEGRIVELPAGATPVDFAYAVHTDIGHACVGARRSSAISAVAVADQRPDRRDHHRTGRAQRRPAEFRGQLESARQNSPDAEESQARRLRRPRPPSAQPRVGRQPQAGRNPQENIQHELDRMKLATLDDLLAEIGLGNAMSVVVAKNLQGDQSSLRRFLRRA